MMKKNFMLSAGIFVSLLLGAMTPGIAMVLAADDSSPGTRLGEISTSLTPPAATRCAFEDYNNKEFPSGSNGSTKGGDHSASDARE